MGRAGPEGRSRRSRARRCRGVGRPRRPAWPARPEGRSRHRPHLDRGPRRAPVQDVRRSAGPRRRQRQRDRPDPAHVRDGSVAAASPAAGRLASGDQRDRLRPGRVRTPAGSSRSRTPARLPLSLDGLAVVLVNGGDGAEYARKALTGTLAAGAKLVVDVDGQNGAPDGVALIDTGNGTLLDALSYEGAITRGHDRRRRPTTSSRERCCRWTWPTRTQSTAASTGSRTAGTRTTPRPTGRSPRRDAGGGEREDTLRPNVVSFA